MGVVMFNKLSFKITALFGIIIFIYLLSIIFIAMPQIKTYVYESETRNIQSQLEKISLIVDSKAKVLENFSQLSLQNHKNRIKDIALIGEQIIEVYYELYTKGDLNLNVAKERAFNEINMIRYGENDYFYVLDNKGILVQHPDDRFLGMNLYDFPDSNGKYFTRELMDGSFQNGSSYTKYWWVKDQRDTALEKIAFTKYFKPWDIYISTGLYIDDLKSDINLQKENIIRNLKNIIHNTSIIKTGYIFIISSDNNMIMHPNELLEDNDFEVIYSLNESLKKAYENKSPFEYTREKNGVITKKIAWVDYNKFFDWYIVVSVPKNELYYIFKNINYTILSISFFVFAFLFLIGIMFIKKLVYPVELLSKDALEIQKGNLTVRNTIDRNDELGVLATQFNFMVSTIEDNVKNLEDKVLLRTQELNDKLYFDDLTKLKNKHALLSELDRYESLTLFILDIDSFDDINELYSYQVGNIVLIEYSKFLLKFCQNTTYELFRVYGNTFALLDKDPLVNINKYERDIYELIESTKKYKAHINEVNLKLEIDIDVTLGAAIFQDNPLRKANMALKYAKKINKRFFVYSSLLDENDRIKNVAIWREQIKDAIINDKIVPFYQPILNRDKKIIKYETLMRMRKMDSNKEESYISPFIFLDIAIKTKQYSRLSEIIIRKALDAAKNEDYTISINLSFADIDDPHLINMLDEYFEKNSTELCSRIIFEILESDHITDYQIFEEFIFKYRKLGIRFAIDDFGTGYSNFTHILAIRPDYIKIDGSLIKNIHTDSNSRELVKSIIKFSQELHIKTIAEFVHSKEVFDIVYELGVDEFQGFYFSPPVKDIKKCKLLNNE